MPEIPTWLALLLAIFGVGGVGTTVVIWLLNYRENRAKGIGAEQSNEKQKIEIVGQGKKLVEEFEKRLETTLNEKFEIQQKQLNAQLEYERKLSAAEREKANLQMSLDFKDETIRETGETLKNIHVEMGVMREKERQCQETVARLENEMEIQRKEFMTQIAALRQILRNNGIEVPNGR